MSRRVSFLFSSSSFSSFSSLSSLSCPSLSAVPGPPCLPLVGSSLQYRLGRRDKTEYHLALLDMFRQYGPLVRENVGGRTIGIDTIEMLNIFIIFNIS